MRSSHILHHVQSNPMSGRERGLVLAQSPRAQSHVGHPSIVLRLTLRHVPDLVGHVKQQQSRVQSGPTRHPQPQGHLHDHDAEHAEQLDRARCALPAHTCPRRAQHSLARPLVSCHSLL